MKRRAKTMMESGPASKYVYSGYLSTILDEPDLAGRDSVDSVTFDAQDLALWRSLDLPHTSEWRQVPVRKEVTEDGIRIEGNFRNVLAIDSLSPDDPRFWVPLSTVDLDDGRFPIDCAKFPIIEVTYRCTSERAHPTWMWTYDGGSHYGALPKSREWITVARNVQHFGFPEQIDHVILRLYSPTRSAESFEIASVRFRAITKIELQATRKSYTSLDPEREPRRYAVLDEFMPLGVYMDAESAKRLAKMLGIKTSEYWDLVLEDLSMRHHNAIALSNVEMLADSEWRDLLSRCEKLDIKIVARHTYPFGGSEKDQQAVLEKSVKPYADSPAIFAHTFSGEPVENDFRDVLDAKERIEGADPNHPVAIVARYPNAYPLFAPFFSASGVGYFAPRRPWDIGKMVRRHVPLSKAQQFWVAAPAFMYPTLTPEWSSCPEMRLMMNLSLANGARGWLAYSYHNDPVWLRGRVQRTLTGPFLTFSDLWLELMQRMKRASALAPLFLQSSNEDAMDDWFVEGVRTDSLAEPAPGIPPISRFHLRGPDFSIYTTVSNNIREMTSVDIDIPDTAAGGMEIHDLSDYVGTWEWEPMPRHRHVEMFPGQAHIMLVASPERCAHWREVIGARLIHDDLRKLGFSLDLARMYGLDVSGIESVFELEDNGASPDDLLRVHSAKDQMTDLLFGAPEIAGARSKILEASAAVCGCDGALCRLMGMGKAARARELGEDVIALAREFTHLRLELRCGNGAKVSRQCESLSKRSLEMLNLIRAAY